MSGKSAKLKLKRKRSTAQEISLEKEKQTPSQGAPPIICLRAQTSPRSAGHDVWWNEANLSEVEQLWASVLKSVTPQLELGTWEAVPDLPAASLLNPSSDPGFADWRWYSLTEEVGPFPPVVKPSVCPVTNMDICMPSSPLFPADSGPVPSKDGNVWQEQEQDCDSPLKTDDPNPPPCQEKRGEEAAGSSSLRLENKGRKQPPSLRDTVGGNLRTVVAAETERSPQGVMERSLPARAGGGQEVSPAGLWNELGYHKADGNLSGAAALASCPMCSMPFPAGFTQMHCDGHLAKCLSEMNEDITW